jgi:hypothetical protein
MLTNDRTQAGSTFPPQVPTTARGRARVKVGAVTRLVAVSLASLTSCAKSPPRTHLIRGGVVEESPPPQLVHLRGPRRVLVGAPIRIEVRIDTSVERYLQPFFLGYSDMERSRMAIAGPVLVLVTDEWGRVSMSSCLTDDMADDPWLRRPSIGFDRVERRLDRCFDLSIPGDYWISARYMGTTYTDPATLHLVVAPGAHHGMPGRLVRFAMGAAGIEKDWRSVQLARKRSAAPRGD